MEAVAFFVEVAIAVKIGAFSAVMVALVCVARADNSRIAVDSAQVFGGEDIQPSSATSPAGLYGGEFVEVVA